MNAPVRIPPLDELVAEQCRRDFRVFARQAWPVIDPSPLVDSWHIDAVADHLVALFKGEIRRLIINIPPRHMKSLLASVLWPAWCWLQQPSWRLLTASYSADLAVEHAVMTRDLVQSEWYATLNRDPRTGEPLFLLRDPAADAKRVKKLKDRGEWYTNSKHGHRIAVGVKGGPTGRGGDCAGVDDPHNPREALSNAMRREALRFWDRTMSTRLNDPRRGRRFMIMQRLHERDLTGHVLAKQLGYCHLKIPAEYNPRTTVVSSLGWRDPRKVEGELISEARIDRATLEELKRELGPIAAAGQLQQDPVPEGGALFREAWIKRWRSLPVKWEAECWSWDLNFGDDDSGAEGDERSYVVGQKWGFTAADAYLLDVYRAQVEFVVSLDAFKARYLHPDGSPRRDQMHVVPLVERKANGAALISSVRRDIPGVVAIDPHGSKEARAEATTRFWASGNVWIPEDSYAEWVRPFVAELLDFPRGLHNDQVDAASQALQWRWLPDVDEDEGARAAAELEAANQW